MHDKVFNPSQPAAVLRVVGTGDDDSLSVLLAGYPILRRVLCWPVVTDQTQCIE